MSNYDRFVKAAKKVDELTDKVKELSTKAEATNDFEKKISLYEHQFIVDNMITKWQEEKEHFELEDMIDMFDKLKI